MSDFRLDPRLRADTIDVAEWPLSKVLLMDDARFPWAILVPRRAAVSEWFDLNPDDQIQLARESLILAAQVKRLFAAQKMNIGALGNIVAQLHVHIVVRRAGDAAWPGPVWGAGGKTPYTDEQRAQVLAKLTSLAPP